MFTATTGVFDPCVSSAREPEGSADAMDLLSPFLAPVEDEPGRAEGLGPRVLEVAQAWGGSVLDVRHFAAEAGDITVGPATGARWRLAGVPVAWVEPRFRGLAWMLAPMLSEVSEEPRASFSAPLSLAESDTFSLIAWEGRVPVLRFAATWRGVVVRGETRHSLQALIASGEADRVEPGVYQVALGRHDRAIVDTGDVAFAARLVHPGRRVFGRPLPDYPFLGLSTFFGFCMTMLGVIALNAPPPSEESVVEIPTRLAAMLLEVPPPDPPPAPVERSEQPKEEEGAKAKGEEGRIGERDARRKEARGDRVRMEQRQRDVDVAANAGVLGALQDMGQLDGVFSDSNLRADLTGGVGGLFGAKGVQQGSGGLSSRGGGLGGGGKAVGLGGLGVNGRSRGQRDYGSESGTWGDGKPDAILPKSSEILYVGNLGRDEIERVIKQNLNRIRYCYQRELQKDPTLSGKVTMRFVIAADGSVSSASVKSSSLNSAGVDQCLNKTFYGLQFPQPRGGGTVSVSYPFLFTQ